MKKQSSKQKKWFNKPITKSHIKRIINILKKEANTPEYTLFIKNILYVSLTPLFIIILNYIFEIFSKEIIIFPVHRVQLESTLACITPYLVLILVALVVTLVIKYRREKHIAFSLIQYPIIFIVQVIIMHYLTWWVIKPGCVGCMSDDGTYLSSLFFIQTPLFLLLLTLVTKFISTRYQEIQNLYQWILKLYLFHLTLLLATILSLPWAILYNLLGLS